MDTPLLGKPNTAVLTIVDNDPRQPLSVTASANPNVIAEGQASTLTASASLGGLGPYAYAWDTGQTGATIVVSPTQVGPHTYAVRATDSLSQAEQAEVTVTVASEVVAEAGDDQTILAGGSVHLHGSATGGLPPYSYSWSPPTGLDDPNIPEPTALPTTTTTEYTLTVTDDLAQTDTDEVTVEVVPGYALTVHNGSGSGTYPENKVVAIKADDPPAEERFRKWTGATANVADVYAEETTVTMKTHTMVTAQFKPAPDKPGEPVPGNDVCGCGAAPAALACLCMLGFGAIRSRRRR